MTDLIRQACLVAKDSAFNVREYTRDSSKMAFLAVKDCEKELDRIERTVDESITGAITAVSEAEARELLACLKFIIDLERIGDLLWSAAKRLQALGTQLSKDDSRDVGEMAGILESMLERIHQGFLNRDVQAAGWVLQTDAHIDEACRAIFRRHLEKTDRHKREYIPRTWRKRSSNWWKAAVSGTNSNAVRREADGARIRRRGNRHAAVGSRSRTAASCILS
jgi:Na+/phosphate symporter